MLSSVLNSERAIEVNIAIMRVFVKLREMISTHKKLELKLNELERKIEGHDESIQTIFEAIRKLMKPLEKPKRKIGFDIRGKRASYGKGAKRTAARLGTRNFELGTFWRVLAGVSLPMKRGEEIAQENGYRIIES